MTKINRRGNSIIEVMVVIIILTIGIVGTYAILNGGQKLSTGAENRIKAINIAREGIEAVENIRDTNWLRFSSDYDNCWRVKDYDVNCIGNTNPIILSGSNLLVQSGSTWMLSGVVNPPLITSYSGYLSQFGLYLDSNGLVVNSGSNTLCGSLKNTNCKMIFTREIRINYPGDDNHMKVSSIVTWVDSSSPVPHTINLETVLTNWKKKF